MKAGFRGWLYRWVSLQFGLLGIFVFLTAVELAKFYGFASWAKAAWIGLGLSFLLFMSAFFGAWIWKRYLIVTFGVALVLSLVYLAFRPEMIRDDVLKQLQSPPLSLDLLFYRGIVLHDDPEREIKIVRLDFLYGLLRTFAEKSKPEVQTESKIPIPEAR